MAASAVWEWNDDHRRWVQFDDAISSSLEAAYNSNYPGIVYSTSGFGGPSSFSVNFFGFDGWKINNFGVATPLRRLPPPPRTPFSSVWEFWSSETSNWSRFIPSSSIEIESKWQKTERSKLFNQPNGLAGFYLIENSTTCGILFATEGFQGNFHTNFIRGLRRRHGPPVTRSVPQENPTAFHPTPLRLQIFQAAPVQSSSPFNVNTHNIYSSSNTPSPSNGLEAPRFGGFNFSRLPRGGSNIPSPSTPPVTSSSSSSSFSGLIKKYDPADLILVSDPEKDRDCSICAESLAGNRDDNDASTQAAASTTVSGASTTTDSKSEADSGVTAVTAATATTSTIITNVGVSLSDSKVVKLSKCKHLYHLDCIKEWFKRKPVCPACMMKYDVITGVQPTSGASMKVVYHPHNPSQGWKIDGYSNIDVIEITYAFQSGIQGPEHPNPGMRYRGTIKVAYLPQTSEGEEILRMLKVAWSRRLIFRVGRSISTRQGYCIIWGGIYHKTKMSGGSSVNGYPDLTYFSRVRQELKDLGVV